MTPAMAVLAGVKSGTGQRQEEGRLSFPVFLLTLAAVTSSLSALSLYQLVALRAEVDVLKSEVCRRREEGPEAKHGGQTGNISSRRSSQEPINQPRSQHAFNLIRRKRAGSSVETLVSQPCLQLMANISRKTFYKGIPWQTGMRRGSALELDGDRILVKQEGFYFVYSQVYYTDSTFAMGHIVIRWKSNVVGVESPDVTLFRCIQNMNPDDPFNTCYTGGVVKLDLGDYLELLIPRPTASLSLDGDCTFLGAFKLI